MAVTKFVLNETSYFGEGARSVLADEIKNRGFKKVLVVTDKSLYEVGVSKKVTDILDEAGIEYGVFHDVLPNPPIANVNAGIAMCKEIGADLIVAVGGGSSIDTAKGISIIMTNPDRSDVVSLNAVREELAAARLNEANLRMEIEQMKLATYAADSVKMARQKLRIDSLRHVTRGVPVVVEEDTLFYFYAKRGGLTPVQRAENVSRDITQLVKRFNLQPDSLYIESSDIVTDVMYDNKVIVSFTDVDGLWENTTRDRLAEGKRQVIIEKLRAMRAEHGFLQLCKRIFYFVLVLIGQYLLFWLTNWLFRKLKLRIVRLRHFGNCRRLFDANPACLLNFRYRQ